MTVRRTGFARRVASRLGSPSRTSLFPGLVGLVAMAALPAFAVLLNLQSELRREREASARGMVLQQAQVVKLAIGQVVDMVKQVTVLVGSLESVTGGSPSCTDRLDRLRARLPDYPLLAVVRPNGKVLCSSAAEPMPDARLTELAMPLLGARTFTVGWYGAAPGEGGLVTFALPLTSPEAGVVIAGLDVRAFAAALRTTSQGPVERSVVLDRRGVVVARIPDEAAEVGEQSPGLAQGAPAGTGDTRIVESGDGTRRAFGTVAVGLDPAGLVVVSALNVADVEAGINAWAHRGALLLLAGLVCSFLLALLFGQRYLGSPAAILLDSARRWGSGDLAARAVTPRGAASELARLGGAFNAMAETLQTQRQELHGLNEALEVRVAERTRALLASNNRLQVEIAERELTEASLRQAQRLQAVGQLAGGMAHEYNNLLTVILSSLELLRRRMPDDPRQTRVLEAAQAAVDRGSLLTAQLLAFSSKQPLLAVSVDLAEVITGMAALLSSTLGASIRIQSRVADDLWPVLLDPNQFEASLLNLALNGRDAMPAGGRLGIVATNVTVGPGGIASDLAPGEYVRLTVSDSGIGMSRDVVSRAFEPFFTTKPPGKGAGLGLSQVHGMVQQTGGSVLIDSRPGDGTTVTMLLPRSLTAPVHRTPGQHRPLPALAGGRAILLVDDDAQVREITALTLAEGGYASLGAAGAAEGMAMLEAKRDSIGLLIVDHAMPGMTGREMLGVVRERWPDLPFLLATGYAESSGLTTEGLTSEQIIRKPFRVAELLARIEAICGRMPAIQAAAGTP